MFDSVFFDKDLGTWQKEEGGFMLPHSLKEIVDGLEAFPEVEGVLLAESRGLSGFAVDEGADYDFYVYVTGDPDLERRRMLLASRCRKLDLDSHFWETEDDGELKDGTAFELIYRNLAEFEKRLEDVVEHHLASVGYSTCFWANLLTSRIFSDKNGNLKKLVDRFSVAYSDSLVQAIVAKNWPLLTSTLSSYLVEVKKAVFHRDWVSIRHQTDAFLASYFDVLFAANRVQHPGDKRLIDQVGVLCRLVPDSFDADMESLKTVENGNLATVLERLAIQLGKLLKREGWLRDGVDFHSAQKEKAKPSTAPHVLVHTDGGCIGNPGKGAWAFLARCGAEVFEGAGGELATTNNRMELLAVIRALETVKSRFADCTIEIRTDSQYVKNGITVWIKTWESNGWKTAAKEPVKNQELWKALRSLNDEIGPRWSWVKGHSGNEDNEYCDQLVRLTMERL